LAIVFIRENALLGVVVRSDAIALEWLRCVFEGVQCILSLLFSSPEFHTQSMQFQSVVVVSFPRLQLRSENSDFGFNLVLAGSELLGHSALV